MTKLEFLAQLRKRLSSLPRKDRKERLNFFSEIIDDRMEEGLSEAEAIAAVCAEEDLTPEAPPRKRKAWEVVLLVLGSPIWLSLLLSAFAVALSLYVSLWAVIISLWAVFAAFLGCALGCICIAIFFFCSGQTFSGIAVLGTALLCTGLGILLFFLCKAATGGTVKLTKFICKARRKHHA